MAIPVFRKRRSVPRQMPRYTQRQRCRRKLFEQLEPRCLLAADSGGNWHPDDLGGTGFGGPFVTTGPPLVSSALSFSGAAEVMSDASFDPKNASTANLFPTAAYPVDGNNNVIVPQAGEPFFVRVELRTTIRLPAPIPSAAR